jgi:hypothetical protein
MRICSHAVKPRVSIMAGTVRPVRLHTVPGITYGLTEAEAIDLVNALADAVDELHSHEGTAP